MLGRSELLFVSRGTPELMRSDDGAEFSTTAVRNRLPRVGVDTPFLTPGSPCENGYAASFACRLRDELVDREVYYTLGDAKVSIEPWCQQRWSAG